MKLALPLLHLALLLSIISPSALACSRFTYNANPDTVLTGRSMDWFEDMHTELWAFPKGMQHTGGQSKNSLTWTASYGSLVANGYNATVDGVNTEGLVINMLYLTDANYGKINPSYQNLTVYTWGQYFLDNYATVSEAVKDFPTKKINMLSPPLANGTAASVHLAITDATGDNAIFEYIDGKLTIHHGKQYVVMTNEPSYDKQLALNDYWKRLNGKFLPGTSDPEDRFVRASYYVSAAPQSKNTQQAVSVAFSIIRDLSVPFSAKPSGRPNVSATIWRAVTDINHHLYYYESTDRPNVFWVDLSKLNLKKGAPVKKLPLTNNEIYDGEVSKYFVDATPYISP